MPQPNLNSKDYYEILGCDRSADENALKKAYRKLAVKWHPDKNPDNADATQKFQKISEAYATLSDSKKRKLYDQYGIDGANAADQMPDGQMPGGFGFSPGGGSGGVHHMSPEDAQNLFSSFFGGSDPFASMGGGMGGVGGMPGISFSMGGMPGGMHGGMPGGSSIPMMFQSMQSGGVPGMAGMGGIPGMAGMGGIPGMAGMGGMPGSKPQKPQTFNSIPPGTVVSLKGLINASDRNGDRGVVQQYMSSTPRYIIQLEDSEETMSVKATNLLQHCKIRVHDVKSQTELNGKTGTIVAWNQAKERYNIYVLALKKIVSLKGSNIVLDEGVVAQITGIVAKPELNGKWGTIKKWIRETNKYDLQLSAQQVIRVKTENVRV